MMNPEAFGITGSLPLAENSPLRGADPRTKLAISLCASLTVMLPLEKILFFLVAYICFVAWARLLPEIIRQAWKLRWIVSILFLVDWLVISIDLAVIVSLRLLLIAGVFTMFFSTTTPAEFCRAMVWLRVPYRYAFSISLSFQAVSGITAEWRGILEAQRSRGAFSAPRGWRYLPEQVRNLVCLTVPAVVLAARRAWAMTEAASARGFDSPRRVSCMRLTMGAIDWGILAGLSIIALILIFWR